MAFQSPIELSDIKTAAQRIAPCIRTTPLVASESLSRLSKTPVYLKLEHHQYSLSDIFLDKPLHGIVDLGYHHIQPLRFGSESLAP